jgi:hypothetical protein
MLVAIIYTGRDVCEDKEKRSLQLFSDWQRPYGTTPGRQVGRHGGPPLEAGDLKVARTWVWGRRAQTRTGKLGRQGRNARPPVP